MKLKKLFAAFLAAVLLVCCLPVAASADASSEPTILYVGEKDKTGDNLIRKLDAVGKAGNVRVYAIDTATEAYYTLTYETGVGYVLTFYNNYTMSEVIENSPSYCGLYCNGDLTVRIAGIVNFDTDDEQHNGAYGWIVKGQLTIERATEDENHRAIAANTPAIVNISGDRKKASGDGESIGISASTLMLHDVTVNALGGYAAVDAGEALVMADAVLYANNTPEMKDGDDPLFEYSIVTKNFIQIGGTVKADGWVNIAAFYFRGGEHIFDNRVVVYGKDYVFAEKSYKGYWSDSFTLFVDPDANPSCMKVYVESSVARISGNQLTLNRRGATILALTIQCGRALIVMDSRVVECKIAFWQWIPYILSGACVDALWARFI